MSGQKDGIFFPRPIIEHSETKPLQSRISFNIQLTIPLYDAHVNNVNLSGRFTTNKIFFSIYHRWYASTTRTLIFYED